MEYARNSQKWHLSKSIYISPKNITADWPIKKIDSYCGVIMPYTSKLPINASMDNTILKKWSVSNAGIYEKYFISDTRNFLNHVYN